MMHLSWSSSDSGRTSAGWALVSGSLALHEPFGGYRTKPPATVNPDISDRGLTGHRQNNTGTYDFGLIYMNARYYLPEIGRFVSADTIVPSAENPQSYNRYGYTLNNPVNFTDPTGHLTDEEIWEFFGFADQEAAKAAGWKSELIELLWDDNFTWGTVFGYNKVGETYTAYAMLALFETGDPSATELEGGFYGVWGARAGQRIDAPSITTPNDRNDDADFMESLFRNNWDDMPVSYGSDYTAIPVYSPGAYVQVMTNDSLEAGVTLIGGTATLVGCAVTPCTALLPLIGLGSSAYGVFAATRDVLSPDVSLFARYPLIQRPRDSIIPGPVQYFDFRPRGRYR